MKKAKLAVTLTLLAVSGLTVAQESEEIEMEARKIGESIFVLFDSKGETGNIGVLTGADGTLIIDDKIAPFSEILVATIASITDQPVRFVINTHWHFDHTGGNEQLGSAGAIIVSQQNSRARMETEQVIELFDMHQGPYNHDALPKITFKESLQFHLNGETIDVFYPGLGHTDGDAIVYFRDSNVIHTGDIFVTYGLPFFDQPNGGSINGLIEAVDTIVSIVDENTVIIPGHGTLSNRQDVLNYRKMLVSVRDQVSALIKENRSFEEILKMNPAEEFPASIITPEVFVSLVYDSLMQGK